MIVDDVEDDLQARAVQGFDHGFELGDLLSEDPSAGIARLGSKEAYGHIAPVVGETPLHEMMVIQEMMDRQELHGGHAKTVEIGEDVGVGEAGVRATPLLGHMGMAGGKTFDV